MYKIAITGKANTGKNTVAKLIFRELDNPRYSLCYKYLAFADPLKEMLRIAYPELPRKWLYGSSKFRANPIPGASKDGNPYTVRQALIDLGNDFGRARKPDIWLANFDHRLQKWIKKDYDFIAVTDVRFRNEFDHLKKLGFFQVRVYRDEHAKIDDVSETNQDGILDSEFDYVIHNNSTLKVLKAEAAMAASKITV